MRVLTPIGVNPRRTSPLTTLEDEIQWAQESNIKALRKLAELDRAGRSYYGDDRTLYPSHFARQLLNANLAVKKAQRKLTTLLNKFKRSKSNPTPRRKTVTRKKRRTPAQQRATRKMLTANKKRRGKKKTRRKRNPAYGNYLTALPDYRSARAALRPRANPVRKLGSTNDYGIKGGAKWFDGSGWTATKANAAKWGNLKTCERVAQKVSDHTNKAVTIHTM